MAEVEAALESWASQASQDEKVSDVIYQTVLTANMGGQLQVRLVEAPETVVALAARRRPNFLDLPFDEAVAAFQGRQVVSPEEFQSMDQEARQRSWTATRLASDTLRQEAYDMLQEALRNGTSMQEFARALRDREISLGVTESDPSYIDTLFRTNVASAFGAGRVAQMSSPEVLDARPYVQYRAIVDPRTTSVCRYLNGLVFDRRTDEGWSRFAPPNHFNCRSTIVLVSAKNVNQSQIVSSGSIDRRGQPLPPFDVAPRLSL